MSSHDGVMSPHRGVKCFTKHNLLMYLVIQWNLIVIVFFNATVIEDSSTMRFGPELISGSYLKKHIIMP